MTKYTVEFTNGKISPRARKMAHPLTVVLLTPSLERRIDTIRKAIEEMALKARLGAVHVDMGTHRGTVYAETGDIPLSQFTIDPPLEPNG